MTQYFYKGHPLNHNKGWVLIDDTRMTLAKAQGLDGFTKSTPVPATPDPGPSAEQLQQQFTDNVRMEVSKRINSVASTATQLNIAAAAAAGILTQDQMGEYLSGLAWIKDMREAGKQLILDADEDFTDDNKWPALPGGVLNLLEDF